ncbi:MAG: type II secretion system F family protein, partial [Thiomargarita sp.]|nr:type II secretion system F family protein [Thiomargarita sp.]
LQAHSILPKKVVYSAIIGTKTNRLDNLFDKLANVYTKKLLSSIELTIKSYTSLLTIIMGVIIGLLVISMYMPIFVMGSVI